MMRHLQHRLARIEAATDILCPPQPHPCDPDGFPIRFYLLPRDPYEPGPPCRRCGHHHEHAIIFRVVTREDIERRESGARGSAGSTP